jgi:UDP-glucose 4-epimerase
VTDLARAHVAAVRKLQGNVALDRDVVNVGTGRGHSVFELLRAFTEASGCPVPHEVVGRRPGDVATSYAAVELSAHYLDWHAEYDLTRMCQDAWRWQSNNPFGFSTDSR